MRDTDWTPSIVPRDDDRDTCLVVNDFGRRGRAWCETDVEATDFLTDLRRAPLIVCSPARPASVESMLLGWFLGFRNLRNRGR
jgi:hypothetical protein